MESLGNIISTMPARVPSSSGKTQTLQPSQNSHQDMQCAPEAFSRAMLALTGLKRTAGLTAEQVECWYAALGGFPARVINAAVLEIALTKERFPEVGDLYAICRRKLPEHLRRDWCPNGSDDGRPSAKEIAAVAARLKLEV